MSDSEKPKTWWERRQSIKHKWHVPFIFVVEWPCEWISYWLGELAFLDILARLGHLVIVVALISYIWGYPERQRQAENQRKAKHYQAWQVINLAQGKPGSGGRKDALQDLHRDGISLVGVDVSQAYLPQIELEKASLWKANFSKANLFGATLSHAVLQEANLSGANLSCTDLSEAGLYGTDVSKANLWGANLSMVNLPRANLSHSNLSKAKFSGANLSEANLSETDLISADISEANLRGTNLFGANLSESNLMNVDNWQKIRSIKLANIYGIKNPPEGFIEWAIEHGAVDIKYEWEWKKFIRDKRQEQTKEK